jgi:hypothetical protein
MTNFELDLLLQKVNSTATNLSLMAKELQQVVEDIRGGFLEQGEPRERS